MFRNGIDAQKLQGGNHKSIESSDLVVTITTTVTKTMLKLKRFSKFELFTI